MYSHFRLDPSLTLGVVTLLVQDLSRSQAYYVGSLGLEVIEESEHQLVASAGGNPLITLIRGATSERPPRSLGLYHFALLLPTAADLARVLKKLVREKVALQGASDHLVSQALYLSDPDGNGIEIYADRPRDLWEWAESRVKMDTLPLDFTKLLAELPDQSEPWIRFPVGATIGHIHLHVSDLDIAENFYVKDLGLDLVSEFPGANFVSAGGYHHHIGLNTWAGTRTAPDGSSGLVSFEMRLPSAVALAQVAERLESSHHNLDENYDGIMTQDPFGNRIIFTSKE
jgi:catechol 2,3-dioxygenase